jgi:hypothetical protein
MTREEIARALHWDGRFHASDLLDRIEAIVRTAVEAETERAAGICEAITWSGDGKWFAARIREGGHVSEP